MSEIYDFSARAADGHEVKLAEYRGQVLLIVNTASKCGFTPQYEGLESIHKTLHGKGLTVLGFPCDQFGHQEPGDDSEIQNFCTTKYDVTFPVLGKVEVNGANAHPLWKFLKDQKSGLLGGAIKWNFTKFLVDRTGAVVHRYAPITKPDAIRPDIEKLLAA